MQLTMVLKPETFPLIRQWDWSVLEHWILSLQIHTYSNITPDTVLCLERGIAGFPRFYRRCPLKMHPVRAYGRALENSRFKPLFRI